MIIPRFYPILDTLLLERFVIQPEHAAAELLDAGVRVLQFRHKSHFSRARFEQAERIGRLCGEAGALFVLNDRADIAAILGAALHVGQDDLPPAAARGIVGAKAVLGFSTHNEAQLLAAQNEPTDYLALGPLFTTGSKENPDPVVGVAEFRRLRPLSRRPLVAIGGITRANADRVFAAGADSVAVIGDLFPNLRAQAGEWLRIAALS